jgi:S-DNA-T family DNA segregation ATPase FtsK/SpoIIIE
MERRYQLMAKTKTKNIENYNDKARKNGEQPFPYIVIIIDELADLMMTSGKDVELSIARLAQMARASGIHLIVATQRPSVDVVTGLIKANLPSRISYKVGQKVDSKIILDAMGAESLLGRGDMLFTPPGSSNLVRIHAPWSDETEIEQVVDYLKAQRAPEYDESILKEKSVSGKSSSSSIDIGDLDSMYDDAKNVVLTDQKTSISYLQRKLRIGYNRSATIMEQLETMGVLSAPNAKGNREIL